MNARNRAWFDEQDQLLAFARALGNGGSFAGDSFESVLRFFERPWKWDGAYQEWCRQGRPRSFECGVPQ